MTRDSAFETIDLIISTNLKKTLYCKNVISWADKCDFQPVEQSYTTNENVFDKKKQ